MLAQFSTRIRELRLSKGLRQDQVADIIGVNKSTISTYESGKRRPSFEVLISLAMLYNVSIDYLLDRQIYRYIDVSELSEENIIIICTLIEKLKEKEGSN